MKEPRIVSSCLTSFVKVEIVKGDRRRKEGFDQAKNPAILSWVRCIGKKNVKSSKATGQHTDKHKPEAIEVEWLGRGGGRARGRRDDGRTDTRVDGEESFGLSISFT
jgi:hypothetical protein